MRQLASLAGKQLSTRPVNIEESQLVKNRNLSRLTSNLSRENWSSEHRVFSVYCFSTVFTLLQPQEVRSTCLPRNLPCLVFESSNTFLTDTWLQTGQQHSSSFSHSSPHPPPIIELVHNKSSLLFTHSHSLHFVHCFNIRSIHVDHHESRTHCAASTTYCAACLRAVLSTSFLQNGGKTRRSQLANTKVSRRSSDKKGMLTGLWSTQ
jgi:hypothetical protein